MRGRLGVAGGEAFQPAVIGARRRDEDALCEAEPQVGAHLREALQCRGARVRGLGLRSVVPPFLVAHRAGEAGLGEVWRHEVRWGRTTRDINPAGYLGSVVTYPLALSLCGWVVLGAAAPAAAWAGALATGAALAVRLWLKGRVDRVIRANGGPAATGPWWLLPGRDMLSFAVFLAALFARKVEWRGARFHVGRDGGLTPV